MTIKTIQKVIKIGSSLGVTIPARDLKHAGGEIGDELEITARVIKKTDVKAPNQDLDADYAAFKAQYGQTLKNLADR